ncbi:MAG: hypothetical protein FJ290_02645 [Planctomycetes bacterium]|nr:hypothetical protein [Planctomycetota bacterium]
MDWTDWHKLKDIDFSAVPPQPGAYVIATNRSIRRAIGVDPDGVLHVGESSDLRYRLRAFLRCASGGGDYEGHMAGWRYAHFRLDRHFPLSSLRVKWRVTKSKPEAYHAEGHFLLSYLRKHCELPPLNYKFNW